MNDLRYLINKFFGFLTRPRRLYYQIKHWGNADEIKRRKSKNLSI